MAKRMALIYSLLNASTGLPKAARAYIDLIEQTVGVPISLISVGPDRSQTISR